MSKIKIYLKDSDKVRLADVRCRIVRESNPRSPAENEDLVFEKASHKEDIPKNALFTWKLDAPKKYWGHEPFWFFTTAERCREMVSPDPAFWTWKKLAEFAKIESKIWQDWCDGHVYGIVIEKWDEKRREWTTISSLWGMYGAKDLFDNLEEVTDGIKIPVCIDNEEMKYDFDNVEMRPNEFS